MYFGSTNTHAVALRPFAAVAVTGTHAGIPGLLPITRTLPPSPLSSVTSFESLDHLTDLSARAGMTVAPSVALAPPVRMEAGEPVSAIRKTSLPNPAASYLARAPAGSQSSTTPAGVARRM